MSPIGDSTSYLAISPKSLNVALLLSLVSVWILVGLFFYLKRFTQRRYFTFWGIAWMFYALWLTLGLTMPPSWNGLNLNICRQWSLGIMAVFLLLGSLRFLGLRTPLQTFGWFIMFLFSWSLAGAIMLSRNIQVEMPLFTLVGAISLITAWCFFQYRRQEGYRGAGLLALAFLLWAIYIEAAPFLNNSPALAATSFILSTVLQLFIAFGMIILVIEEFKERQIKTFHELRAEKAENQSLQQKVQSTEDRYRNLFNQTTEGIIITAAGDLRILELNDTAGRLLGITRSEACKQFLPSFCETADSSAVQPNTHTEWFRKVSQVQSIQIVSKQGASTLTEVEAKPIDFQGQSAYQFSFRTITDRSQLESQLRRAEKLSALGQMVSGVAHELNNPMAVIKGYVDLILEKHSLDPRTRMDLEKISQEANRASKLVKNFLAFAREQSPCREMMNVNETIERLVDLRRFDLSRQGVTVDLRLEPQLPSTLADTDLVQQLVINLVNNALQAMQGHTRSPHLVIATRQCGNHLIIQVEDNGPGIPPEILGKIFEPYFTTKPPGIGTGLGLSLAHSIMAEHHGRITYRPSTIGGASFIAEFPIVSGPASPRAESAAASTPAPPVAACKRKTGASILVLDDEEVLTELLAETLSSLGHHPTICLSPAEALECLKHHDFDLILSDFHMPGMNGDAFFQALRERHPHLTRRIIFLTGDLVSEETNTFLASTGNPHLEKPFHLSALEQAVAGMLGRKDPAPAAAS